MTLRWLPPEAVPNSRLCRRESGTSKELRWLIMSQQLAPLMLKQAPKKHSQIAVCIKLCWIGILNSVKRDLHELWRCWFLCTFLRIKLHRISFVALAYKQKTLFKSVPWMGSCKLCFWGLISACKAKEGQMILFYFTCSCTTQNQQPLLSCKSML